MKKKSYLVIGLGRFGAEVAKTLSKMNCDVLAIDKNEDSVAAVANEVDHALVGDSTKLGVLQSFGTKNITHAIIAIGNDLEASIVTLINLTKLGVSRITVRADSEEYKEIFLRMGATDVIIPEVESAVLLANEITSDTILDYYIISGNHVMVKIMVSTNLGDKTLIDLNVRNIFKINIVGIIREEEFFLPLGTDKILPNDIVVVCGTRQSINKFDKFLNQ